MEQLKSYEQMIHEIDKKILQEHNPVRNDLKPGERVKAIGFRSYPSGIKAVYGKCKAGDKLIG